MNTDEKITKIFQWIKELSKTTTSIQRTVEKHDKRLEDIERKMSLRMDIHDERIDALSDAIQSLLKGMRSLRAMQFEERERVQKQIQKIREEIRELLH